MAAENKNILVYADWEETGGPTLMGNLMSTHIRGKEVFSFNYEDEWLGSANAAVIDPALRLYGGAQYLSEDKPNFGVFLDSSPDRWGRVLMKRRAAILARQQKEKPATLFESDFLLGVYDLHRMGALRFKLDRKGDFLGNEHSMAAPPFTSVRELEEASLRLEKSEEQDDKYALKWINLLLAPGASLGGARPKASVRDAKGELYVAKFPSVNDEWDTVCLPPSMPCGLGSYGYRDIGRVPAPIGHPPELPLLFPYGRLLQDHSLCYCLHHRHPGGAGDPVADAHSEG